MLEKRTTWIYLTGLTLGTFMHSWVILLGVLLLYAAWDLCKWAWEFHEKVRGKDEG